MIHQNNKDAELISIRDQIDEVDSSLLDLINLRISLAKQIGVIKQNISGDSAIIYRPEREAQVIRRLTLENNGGLNPEQINLIFREVMSVCRGAEARLQISALGPKGTFTEIAALQQFGSSVEIALHDRIDQIFNAVETGNANYGVVPVENSTEGIVNVTADLLASTSLIIAGEILLPIHQSFLSTHTELSKIKKVFSHAQSFAQCRMWLQDALPGVEIENVSSNAVAAEMAANCDGCAAIAGENAATQYGLNVLANRIEDNKENTTRFLVLSRESVAASGKDKTSLLMSCKNEPGSLFKLLKPLHDHGVSMLKIESRPSKTKRWEYLFFVDIEGHQNDQAIKPALEEVEAAAGYFRVLGAYPSAN